MALSRTTVIIVIHWIWVKDVTFPRAGTASSSSPCDFPQLLTGKRPVYFLVLSCDIILFFNLDQPRGATSVKVIYAWEQNPGEWDKEEAARDGSGYS